MGMLTDRGIRAAKVETGEKYLADGEGLYLRIRMDGSRTWFFRYSRGAERIKMQLGIFPAMGLAEAREIAAELTGKRRRGIDPRGQREAERAAAEAARLAAQREAERLAARITVRKLFERWAAVDLIRHKDGGDYVRKQLEHHALPSLGELAVEDVRKAHITAVTDVLLAAGKERTAKVIFSLIRQMFRFAQDRDILEHDPTSSLRKKSIGGKDTERDRILSEDEIRALVRQLPRARLSASAKGAVWICLATLCRIGELLSARWEHIDLERGTWWIPPENSKNGKPHTVYLSAFALLHFRALHDAAEEAAVKVIEKNKDAKLSPWVYPNRSGDGPVCPKTTSKQIGDRQREGKPPMKRRTKTEHAKALSLAGGKWTPHDLRRTGATMMVALGVLPEVAERCLNHTEENKVKRIYQRHSYENEMREGWRLLGDRLALLTNVDADNVVPINRAA